MSPHLPFDPAAWEPRLVALAGELRRAARTAARRGLEARAVHRPVGQGVGDLTYALDEATEAALTRWFEDTTRHAPLSLFSEDAGWRHRGPDGASRSRELDGFGHGGPRLVIDPVDGTRPLMADLRSAWSVIALCPPGAGEPRLAEAVSGLLAELPDTRAARYRLLLAVKGAGARLEERRLDDDFLVHRARLVADADDRPDHGVFSVFRYTPAMRPELARIEAEFFARLERDEGADLRQCFDDQYISNGGQLALLALGTYRLIADLKPLMFQGMQPGGQLTITTDVENYPGYPEGVMGPAMMEEFKAQAARFGTEIRMETVHAVDLSKRPFKITSDFGEVHAKSIIISTGASARLLGLENESKLMGKGVSACATCDGAFYPDKEVLVVGAGDTAMEEATYLTRFASKVTIVHRSENFRASEIMIERAKKNPKIDWMLNKQVKDIIAGENGVVRAALLEDTQTGETTEVECQGVFIAIGHTPNSDLFKDSLELDDNGYIQVQLGSTRTNVEGVFASGDVMDHVYRQAVTAAGTGCMAAIDAERWLESQEG